MLVVFGGAQVTDTLLHLPVRALPSAATLAGMYGVQVVLSYVIVPSSSGQAALSCRSWCLSATQST